MRFSVIVKDHAVLTAGCSAIELLRNTRPSIGLTDLLHGRVENFYSRWFKEASSVDGFVFEREVLFEEKRA